MKEELVSVIVPVYNAEKFIIETMESVRRQTYKSWELILVDDMSTDKSCQLIEKYQKKYSNKVISLIKLKKKGMAAGARNEGVKKAQGRYICFLDADDLWDKHKLEKQVAFMKSHNCAFSYTGYEFSDSKGLPLGTKVYVPETLRYKEALKNTTIWTTTVMFDMEKITKELIEMPNIKSEDTATWWKILKSGYVAYGLNEILSYYRRSEKTLSSNKLEAIKRIWMLYRKVEGLSLISSIYNFCFYAVNAVKRRI